jgi:hypothetical protein
MTTDKVPDFLSHNLGAITQDCRAWQSPNYPVRHAPNRLSRTLEIGAGLDDRCRQVW